MNDVYLLLGANLGEPLEQIKSARQLITDLLGEIIDKSSIYQSEAWGIEDQPHFYNQVLSVKTAVPALEALQICQQVENTLGRVRKEKWGARVIDIDILYYNHEIINVEQLTVPHPYLHLRRFTLEPLVEIASDYVHPVYLRTNTELLNSCTDTLSVVKLKA